MDKLNFVWKNGLAPALNAANLQLITNTINEVIDDNESIHESMALIKSNEVVANPASAPKKVLKSVRIGEVTYLVEGGGGSGETEYDLVDSQEGTTSKTMSLPADTKQIVIMAYMNHTYQGVLFEGSAVIDLDSKTITATAPELEEKLYNKYLNQIWRDKGELYHEHQYEYNKISDTEYSFMWMGREGYGTETVTIDGNSIIVNSSYESLGVAIIGVIAGGLQTIDAEFVRIGEKSLQNFFDNGWGFGDVSFTMDSSREETRLRPGIIQVKNILSGNDYSQLWPNKVVVAAYNTNIQILQNDITAYNSVLGEGSVSVLDTIDSLKTSLNNKVNKWKYFSDTTGLNSISFSDLPSDASELLITGFVNNQSGTQQKVYQTTICLPQLATNKLIVLNLGGYIYSTTDFGYCDVNIDPTNKTIAIRYLFDAGQNKNSSAGLVVRYR